MGLLDSLAQSLVSQVVSQQLNSLESFGLNSLASVGLGGLIGTNFNQPAADQFNIDVFRNNLSQHGEIAKEDKFIVMMPIPPIVQQASGAQMQELTLQCEGTELPSRDINVIEYRHYGFIKRIPHMNQYGQAQFSFISAGDMWEKRVFDMWLDIMVPSESGLVSYPLDINYNPIYETQIQVSQYNQNGSWIYSATLIDAIPIAVAPLTLDWSADTPHKMQVTFAFRKWLSDATTANVAPTDFGTAVGQSPTLAPLATSPINNQTNNPLSGIPFNPFSPVGSLGSGSPLIPTISIPSISL